MVVSLKIVVTPETLPEAEVKEGERKCHSNTVIGRGTLAGEERREEYGGTEALVNTRREYECVPSKRAKELQR